VLSGADMINEAGARADTRNHKPSQTKKQAPTLIEGARLLD